MKCADEGKELFTDYRLACRVRRKQCQQTGEKLSVYRCVPCNGWHIGASLGKSRKRDLIYDESGIEVGAAGKLK